MSNVKAHAAPLVGTSRDSPSKAAQKHRGGEWHKADQPCESERSWRAVEACRSHLLAAVAGEGEMRGADQHRRASNCEHALQAVVRALGL